MSQILDFLYEAFPNLDEILFEIGFIVLLLGIAEAFFGYKLFLKLMSIIGFLIGGFLGLLVYIYAGNSFYDSGKLKIYMLIGAVIGAVVANTFYKLSVFIGVFACSFFFFFLIIQNTTVSLMLGVICGVVGVIIDKYCIIVTTGLAGGKLAAMGIWLIELSEGKYGNVGLIGWMIGIGGIIFQIWLEMKNPAKEGDSGILDIDIFDIVLVPCILIYSAGKWIWNLIKGSKEGAHDLLRQKNHDKINTILSYASFGLPILAGMILGVIFQSFVFGIAIILLTYILLLYIRKRRAEISEKGYTQKYAWEKWTDQVKPLSKQPPKQSFCAHCGAKMSDNARFCSKCGTARRL